MLIKTPLICALLTLVALGAGLAAVVPGAQDEPVEAVTLDLSAVTILTSRFPEMLAFYSDTLGLAIERLDEEDQFAEFHSDGVALHLTTMATMKSASGAATFDEERRGHAFELAFEVERKQDVDRLYTRIVAGGATPVAPPADKPWGQRMAFFADPDGNVHDVFARY